ncbi:MAG: hypothetical protein HQ517_14610 [SAR324 cluster bacterium]|nr:hypothetical protein [SAR324 cluster bacterium]
MTSLSKYQDDINSLSSQLQKLLKVIRHPDPSADALKHLLYDKYQKHLATIARQIKGRFHWCDFHQYLLLQTDPNESFTESESQEVIRKKLINDFEKEFIGKQVLTEFTSPDPTEIRLQREFRKKSKVHKANLAAAEAQYSKESIMEMVQTKQQQRQAHSDLQSLIEAIKKIDPHKLEQKISQSLKPQHN